MCVCSAITLYTDKCREWKFEFTPVTSLKSGRKAYHEKLKEHLIFRNAMIYPINFFIYLLLK